MCSLNRVLVLLFVFTSFSWSQDVSTPSEVLKGISDDVMKELRLHRTGEPYPKAALEKANQQLEAYCKGKSGTFSLVVSEVDEKSSKNGNILIKSKVTSVRLFGKSVDLVTGFVLDASHKPQIAKIKPGARITATGEPWATMIWLSGRYELGFWLDKATLK